MVALIPAFFVGTAQAQTPSPCGGGNNPCANPTAPTYTLLEPLPCINGGSTSGCTTGTQVTSPNFQTYIQDMFNLLIALAAVAAVFMIVWGGFQYMTTDAWQGKEEGKKKLWNAVLGLLLILSSYLILKTIDPRLVEIPSTLVKPLNIQYTSESSTLSSFFDQMQIDANKYNVQAQSYVDSAKQAKTDVANLQNHLDSLNAQLITAQNNYDFATEANLKVEIANTQNQINAKMANVAVQNNNGIVTNITSSAIGQMSAANSVESVQTEEDAALNAVELTTANRIQQLQSLGAADQVSSVVEFGKYNEALITIKSEIATVIQATTLSGFVSAIGNGQPLTQDQRNAVDSQKAASISSINYAVAAYSHAYPNSSNLQTLVSEQQQAINAIKAQGYHQ